MAGREIARLGAAALLGAAIAFPLGLMLAPGDGGKRTHAAQQSAPAREVFSPSVAADPWFVERQREGIEALERACRESGAYCAEAAQGRRWLVKQD